MHSVVLPEPDPVAFAVSLLRSLTYLVGIAVAVRYTPNGIHARYVNVVVAVGFTLAVFNGTVLGLNTAHYHVEGWLIDVALALSVPQVVCIVGGFVLRIYDSLRIRARIEAETQAEIAEFRRFQENS